MSRMPPREAKISSVDDRPLAENLLRASEEASSSAFSRPGRLEAYACTLIGQTSELYPLLKRLGEYELEEGPEPGLPGNEHQPDRVNTIRTQQFIRNSSLSALLLTRVWCKWRQP